MSDKYYGKPVYAQTCPACGKTCLTKQVYWPFIDKVKCVCGALFERVRKNAL